jgi:hypothetical protein
MPLSPRAPARPSSASRRSHPAGSATSRGPGAALGPDELTLLAARLAAPIDATAAHRGGRARWWTPLGATSRWDAWLEGWPPGDAIELHDHGGSTAVVQVLAGRLLETWLDGGGGLRRRRLEAGSSVWLPRQHVHDLVNVDPIPALSVHVYSPPLRTMTWYTTTPRGGAVPLRCQQVSTAELA